MKTFICPICQPQINELKKMILKINKDVIFDEKCQSLCGIGATHSFVLIDGIPYYEKTNELLIKKLEGVIK